ncbi:MAG: hypothetical protein OXU20_42645 [Myxococcales bacterium]|nr:hypothetical protein [Myxococcales bacterium]MDD9968614.1 hypothetical protein [Myxococcales bacterium]
MSAVKVSVSLEESDLKWLKKAARRQKASVSGLLGQAVGRMRREEALDEVVAYLGKAAQVDEDDVARLEAEWKD